MYKYLCIITYSIGTSNVLVDCRPISRRFYNRSSKFNDDNVGRKFIQLSLTVVLMKKKQVEKKVLPSNEWVTSLVDCLQNWSP